MDRLQKALPDILNGYCKNSNKPREVAEEEVKQFLRVIEDSASYQFGYNHAVAYSMIGYMCGYLRYYYPIEFICAMFNCSKTEEDFAMITSLAKFKNIRVLEPRFRAGKPEYSFDKESNTIYKGMKSIKYLNEECANELYSLRNNQYESFTELLYDISKLSINTRQLEILIKLDFFEEFGNSKELMQIYRFFSLFRNGTSKNMKKDKISNDEILCKIVARNSSESNTQFTKLNTKKILEECEEYIKCSQIKDFSYKEKIATQKEYLGYINLYTGIESDRRKLIVTEKRTMVSKFEKDKGEPWAVIIKTQSIGSGIKGSFTIPYNIYKKEPFDEMAVIYCDDWERKRGYNYMKKYHQIF